MSRASGRKIGSFVVERELGQGGMGVVYLARQPALERPVVLKTLRRDLADEPSLEERFQREAQAAAGIHHQNVVAVYDCFSFRGESFIAQEYVEGMDLASILQAAQRLSPRVAALIALEMTRGLEEIHARGVVHRDLKPANILLGREGETKIADFGIALDGKGKALTQVGVALGTPQYMSLEQLLGERADYRSDLFSLGVVLYEMLTGETPFAERESSEDGPSLARRIQGGRFPSPRRRSPTTPRLGDRRAPHAGAAPGCALPRRLPQRDCRLPLGAKDLPGVLRKDGAREATADRPAPQARRRGLALGGGSRQLCGRRRRRRGHGTRGPASAAPPGSVRERRGGSRSLRDPAPDRDPDRRRRARGAVDAGRAGGWQAPRRLRAPPIRPLRAHVGPRIGRGARPTERIPIARELPTPVTTPRRGPDRALAADSIG
jgi:serine/threonine protein kinase